MPRVANTKALFTVFLVTGALLFVVFGVNALSGGIDRETAAAQGGDLAAGGCSCHNPVASSDVVINVSGIPPIFTPGTQYSVWVNFTGGPEISETGNAGGFNVLATGGSLKPAAEEPQSGFTQAKGDQEITHTSAGARDAERQFNFIWDSTGAPAAVTFVVTVNAVDGNNAPAPPDAWNRLILSSVQQDSVPEEVIGAGGAGAKVSLHSLGVNFLAYWVGVISFALLFIVYGATFFLFKYGESAATTDHFDRPDAVAASKAAPVHGKSFWIMILVALIALAIVVGLLIQRGYIGG